MLDLEERTPLQVQVARGRVALPEDDLVADLYLEAIERLGRARAASVRDQQLRAGGRGVPPQPPLLDARRVPRLRPRRAFVPRRRALREHARHPPLHRALAGRARLQRRRSATTKCGARRSSSNCVRPPACAMKTSCALCGQEGIEWIERGLQDGWLRRVDGTRGVHARRVSAKQRLHLAALLIAALALRRCCTAQTTTSTSIPTITQEEFETVLAPRRAGDLRDACRAGRARAACSASTSASPRRPCRSTRTRRTGRTPSRDDFTISDHVAVPRLVVSKGLSVATVSAMYAKVPDSDIEVWGGVARHADHQRRHRHADARAARRLLDSCRASTSSSSTTYGVELFLSKGSARSRRTPRPAARAATPRDAITLRRRSLLTLTTRRTSNRFTVGVKHLAAPPEDRRRGDAGGGAELRGEGELRVLDCHELRRRRDPADSWSVHRAS